MLHDSHSRYSNKKLQLTVRVSVGLTDGRVPKDHSFALRALNLMVRAATSTALRLVRRAGPLPPSRSYNFAASNYARAFDRNGYPEAASGDDFRKKVSQDTVAYLERFEPASWSDDPVVTLLKGEALTGGSIEDTWDAFETKNGKVVQATREQVDAVIAHMAEYVPPKTDYREEVRAMEREVFDVWGGSPWPAFLVGNQALDFKKQDGITEIEESVQANTVERRLADLLLQDEADGKVRISRAPAYVGCVSNFSNFLDLSRKTLRNIELGVPAVVLSRSNTTQHMFRWARMLVELMPKYGVDAGMVTYLAAPRREKARVFETASSECPMYFTCSREVAKDLRSFHGPVMASTGGPNTLVASQFTPSIAEAVKLSATIENSGQCTALRHAVVNCSEADVRARRTPRAARRTPPPRPVGTVGSPRPSRPRPVARPPPHLRRRPIGLRRSSVCSPRCRCSAPPPTRCARASSPASSTSRAT